MSDLANDVVAEVGRQVLASVALLTPTGGLTYGEEARLVGRLRIALCANPNVGAVLFIAPTESGVRELAEELRSSGRLVRSLFLVEEVDSAGAVRHGVEMATGLASTLSRVCRRDVGLGALRVALRSSSSSVESLTMVNPVVGSFVDHVVGHGGSVGFSEIADLAGAVDQVAAKAASPLVASAVREALVAARDCLLEMGRAAPDPTPTNRLGGIETLEQKSVGALRRLGSSPIESVLRFGQAMPNGGMHMMLGPGSAVVSLAGLAAAGCNLLVYTVGVTSITAASPLMPAIMVAPDTLRGSRDVDVYVTTDGDDDELLRMVLSVAVGRQPAAGLSPRWPLMLPNYLSPL